MRKRKPYKPPPLKERVLLVNPADIGNERTRYGIATPQEGDKVYAHRRDVAPRTLIQEGVTVKSKVTVWTIRYRDDLPPDIQVHRAGVVYQSIGPAPVRGGAGQGRRAKYLEIHTELRT